LECLHRASNCGPSISKASEKKKICHDVMSKYECDTFILTSKIGSMQLPINGSPERVVGVQLVSNKLFPGILINRAKSNCIFMQN
jgi:hypothetical protein